MLLAGSWREGVRPCSLRLLHPFLRLPAAALLAACLASATRADVITLTASIDTSIFSESGAVANGAGDSLFVGRTLSGVNRRALLQFDVAGAVPAGATIESVTLMLHLAQTTGGGQSVGVHRLLASWAEGTSSGSGQGAPAAAGEATWTHRFFGTTDTWTSAGGDFDAAASEVMAVAVDTGETYSWTSGALLDDVQAWLDAPAANFGWIMIGNETSPQTAMRFLSSENSVAGLRPQLVIDYTVAAVPEPALASMLAGLAALAGLTARRWLRRQASGS